MPEADPVREQLEYYRARAPEYEDWFYRRGRYNHGGEANAQWLREIAAAEHALAAFAPLGNVVELAAGTGIWTRWLVALADHVTAVDASEEMLAINRVQARADNVAWVQADVFEWRPTQQFDHVFMGFWLSHVPLERLDDFWQLVEFLVRGKGAMFFVDSLYSEMATATDQSLEGTDATEVTRRLNDGREFRIVKVFHDPVDLQNRLIERGWSAQVHAAGDNLMYGSATIG